MKAARWAVVAAGERAGLHGSRKAACDQIADLRQRGIEAQAIPVSEPPALTLSTIRFGPATSSRHHASRASRPTRNAT